MSFLFNFQTQFQPENEQKASADRGLDGSKDSKAETHNFEVSNLSCRPCSKLGYSKCPKKHFDCMNKQEVDKIIQIANNWS